MHPLRARTALLCIRAANLLLAAADRITRTTPERPRVCWSTMDDATIASLRNGEKLAAAFRSVFRGVS